MNVNRLFEAGLKPYQSFQGCHPWCLLLSGVDRRAAAFIGGK